MNGLILHCDLKGNVQSVPSSVPMGTILDDVVIIAPHTCAAVILKIKPPYQTYLPDIHCSPVLTVGDDGKNMVVFRATLPKSITTTAGRAEYQVSQTDQSGKTIATYAGSFNVSRGVLVDMPEDVDELSNYSLEEIYRLLSNVSLVFNQLVTIENLIGYPTEELSTVEQTIIGAINDLDDITKKHGISIGNGNITVPDNLKEGESGLIGLANAAYVKLVAHIAESAMSKNGNDPHHTREAIDHAIDVHNTDATSHPSILADVSRNTARIDVAEQDIAQLESDVGKADLETIAKNLKGAVNEVNTIAKRAKEHANTNEAQLISINAQLQGVGRSYALEDFNEFLNFINGSTMLPIYEDRNGDGIDEQYIISVAHLKTGDNILLAEKEVPDFWFEKTQTESDKTYEYNGFEHPLNAYFNGTLVGVLHILETDWQVIAGHAMSAGQSAANAAASALEAKETEASIDKMVDELYFNQIAPPFDDLENSVFLATPTYEML